MSLADNYQHRRKQTRLAQRAYRDRQEETFKVMIQNCKELEVMISNVAGSVENLRKVLTGSAASLSHVEPVLNEYFQNIDGELSSLAAKSVEIQQAIVRGSRQQTPGNKSKKGRTSTGNDTTPDPTTVSHEADHRRDQTFSQPNKQNPTIFGNETNRLFPENVADPRSRNGNQVSLGSTRLD